jgi:hypothetical protein
MHFKNYQMALTNKGILAKLSEVFILYKVIDISVKSFDSKAVGIGHLT